MKVKFLKNFNSNSISSARSFFSRSSDKNDEVTNLINGAGYRGDAFKVKTEDGYVLTLHRVRSKKREDFKGTAFLMHGLFRNSADFLATGPSVALPYLLADNGYDIFIGNSRGSKYCNEHEKFSSRSSEFWNFSWHEIGYYDLPALIEFAINKSRSSKIFYTGHSQGCTTILALLSSRPFYNSLISQMHLMAPSVFMRHSTSPAFRLGSRTIMVCEKFKGEVDFLFDIFKALELLKRIKNYSCMLLLRKQNQQKNFTVNTLSKFPLKYLNGNNNKKKLFFRKN
jgi:predicted esterase